jgi:hypothetical protein
MAAVPPQMAFQASPPAPENQAAKSLPPPPPMGAGPEVPEESGRNVLAVVSLIASLFFPLGIVLSLLGVVARSNGWPLALSIFPSIGASLAGIFGIPAILCAIATGHVAWIRRKRYSQANRLGWMAIVGLCVGYVSVAFVLAVIAIIITAVLQGG